ncbi:MAG: hypothetical protein HC897_06685 [Thermoanaerobaculia bacterium]|nr:hypothetical protein [Thermoanaerobaculia bacterium]
MPVCDIAAAIVFAGIWILVLVQAFGYRDLLFPLRPETVAQERGGFEQLAAPSPRLTPAQINKQRIHYQKNVLKNEIDARGLAFESRLREWRAWQGISPEEKTLAFGLLTMITLGSLVLLHLAFRSAKAIPKVPFARLVRTVVATGVALLAVFQACLLPLTYGIAMKRRDFPVVRVNQCDVSELAGQTALFLGEAGGRVYLYQDDALWILHVIAADAITDWQIEGRRTAPAWIEEWVDLPTQKGSP